MGGKMIFIIVDSHSKRIGAFPVSTTSSAVTIEKLHHMMAQFGLPQTAVLDNAPNFTSEDFEHYLKLNGIQHSLSSPYHPSISDLVERAVQTLKKGLKKVKEGTMEARIARILFSYKITPHSTTGVSPS